MAAIFERFRDDSGCYRFQLKTAAGEVIALSDAYLTRVSADGAIDAIRRHAAQFTAQHHAGRSWGRRLGEFDRLERFNDLDDAKRACDRWRRTGCIQSITEVASGACWVRIDIDGEWSPGR